MTQSRRAPWTRTIVGVLSAALLAGCADDGDGTETSQSGQASPSGQAEFAPATVKLGTNGVASDAAIFLAMERGYFAKLGLTVEMSTYRAAGDMIPLLASGQLQAAGTTFDAGFVNAILKGTKFEVIADKGSFTDGSKPSYGQLVVRKQAAGEIDGPEDFKGKTIAFGGGGSGANLFLSEYLKRGGLSLKDVRIVTLSQPDRVVALKQGAADVAYIFEPSATQAIEQGVAQLLITGGEVIPNGQQSVLTFPLEWSSKNPEAAKRFASAYMCGVEDYNRALEAGGTELADMWKIVAERGEYPLELLQKAVPARLDPKGHVNTQDIERQIAFYKSEGFTKEVLPVADVVNHKYVDERIPCDQVRPTS